MSQETSFGVTPFNHDTTRGKWSSPKDFLFACLGHAFKVDAVLIMPSLLLKELGLYGIIPYFLILATCVVPIVFMQSFLGQFSSTGFLSVFRIAPLFKGIGFVSLAINLITLMYFSVYGAIPLFYFFNTLRPIVPWSCEGAEEWMEYKNNTISVCSENQTEPNANETIGEIPSLEFFKIHLKTMEMHEDTHPEGTFSWPLMLCTFVIWIITAVVATRSVEKIGRFLRHSCIAVIVILVLCVVRLAFLPEALSGLKTTILYSPAVQFGDAWIVLPLVALSALGPGWGSVLTMASYNKFKTDVLKYSWLLCVAQLGIIVGLGLMSVFVSSSLQRGVPHAIFVYMVTQWMEFLVTPTALTFIELPRIWSLLFFTMMILGSLNLLIVQLFSVLTSLFDEYESLREKKREVTLGIIVALALTSIYFCSNYGFTFSELLSRFSLMTQIVLNLLLLIVVVWVYGRERFQRDLTFMTSRVYATWKINVVRFVAPLFLLFGFLGGLLMSISFGYVTFIMLPVVTLITLAMWCFIPGYCIVKLKRMKGMLRKRFRRSIVPVNWYPAEPRDRQRYEESFPSLETTNNGSNIVP